MHRQIEIPSITDSNLAGHQDHASPCPVCAARADEPFLKRRGVPVHQNLIVRDQAAAVAIARGNLELSLCQNCGFIFNRAFDASLLSYGSEYENTQSYSPYFAQYVDGLVEHLMSACAVRNCRILEVGCGKGGFLAKLVSFPGSGNSGIGFDSSYVGPAQQLDGRLVFERRPFDRTCGGVAADVVLCRHVIEHVSDPVELLRSMAQALANDQCGRVFVETPCVEWILRNGVFWDFFYEHCSYFSPGSLATALECAGFQIKRIAHVFGGQYLWGEAVVASGRGTTAPHAGKIPELAAGFAERESELVCRYERGLYELAIAGPIAFWGAGAKGVTLANLVDPDCTRVVAVVDLNPEKQGNFLPGTGHPIVAPRALARLGVRTAIQMNPNYHQENEKILRDLNLNVQLLESTRHTNARAVVEHDRERNNPW